MLRSSTINIFNLIIISHEKLFGYTIYIIINMYIMYMKIIKTFNMEIKLNILEKELKY